MTDAEPASVCRALLAALAASDGRRQKRKRDTTADAIGMSIKRRLLENAVRDAPPAADFEAWLLGQCLDLSARDEAPLGAARAVAQELYADWQLALASPSFLAWLSLGAPSQDGDH